MLANIYVGLPGVLLKTPSELWAFQQEGHQGKEGSPGSARRRKGSEKAVCPQAAGETGWNLEDLSSRGSLSSITA